MKRCTVRACAGRYSGRACPLHPAYPSGYESVDSYLRMRPNDVSRGGGRQIYVDGRWVGIAQAKRMLSESEAA